MISIIILTFNSIQYIKSCLDSVFLQDFRGFEVIAVDNGSCDGTVDFIKDNYPQVVLIENKENEGACKARNQGIEISKGEWVLTLDCDIILENNFIREAQKKIKAMAPDIGIIQPKILKQDKKTIYSAGIFLSTMRRFYDIGTGSIDSKEFDDQKYIFGACSAATFYSRMMLEDTREASGYFDERFFFLVEDVDLAWRAKRKEWKALYYPSAKCYHYGGSSRLDGKLRKYLCLRNRYLMINKNETALGKIKLYSLSFWYEIPRILYSLITNRYIWKLT